MALCGISLPFWPLCLAQKGLPVVVRRGWTTSEAAIPIGDKYRCQLAGAPRHAIFGKRDAT